MSSTSITWRDWLPWLAGMMGVLLVLVLVPLPFQSALSQSTSGSVDATSEAVFQEGLELAQRGAFEQASVKLHAAADGFAKAGQPLKQSDALSALAQVYLGLGYHLKAAQSLELALSLVQTTGDRSRLGGVMGALGGVYLAAGRADAASDYLKEALDVARQEQDQARAAAVLNELGRLDVLLQRYEAALDSFSESQWLATSAGLPELAATAMVNAGNAASLLERHEAARTWFDQALPILRGLPASHGKAYGLITLGLGYSKLGEGVEQSERRPLLLAVRLLEEAGDVAKVTGDRRAASYALGYRGHMYEQRGRHDEALLLTRLAISAVREIQAPEALYRWEWQMGRLLHAQGDLDGAILAYKRARDIVQGIRSEMPVTSRGAIPSFRESGGQVYFELADLLLRRAAEAEKKEHEQSDLREAREVVELFKSAELRDYFRDDCVDALQARERSIDDISDIAPRAVVVYPILLSDRVEVLITLPTGIHRKTLRVSENEFIDEVRLFRRLLEKRTTREFLPHGQQLYDWLIRPIEPIFEAQSVNTLVLVPDGALRTIPLSALHDGEKFLIEKYAIATTPGLNLTDPRPLRRDRIKVFSAGLTESVQGFPAMPNVMTELNELKSLYGRPPLLNEKFLSSTVEKELRDEEFTVVHVASHAQFKKQVDETFLLTFDEKLTMDELSRVVGYFRFREEPLELLTLSACETAAGDDRAALGLAGVAIKAGARSALATLWFVNDEASSLVVANFYKELQDPALSKAKALQRAQISLIQDRAFRHPSYWAPFLLLNNWL